MNTQVVKAVIKLLLESLAITAMVSAVIAIIGYINKWDLALTYSNAFFMAGIFVIIAGTSSRLAAGQDWTEFQLLGAESFRHMSSGERANFIVNINSPIRLVILGVLSGLFLILISAIAAYLF